MSRTFAITWHNPATAQYEVKFIEHEGFANMRPWSALQLWMGYDNLGLVCSVIEMTGAPPVTAIEPDDADNSPPFLVETY